MVELGIFLGRSVNEQKNDEKSYVVFIIALRNYTYAL